jgi:rRNA maturation RNase YbeY
MAISFFTQDIKFTLMNKTIVRSWLTSVAKKEGAAIEELNYIFCSDNYLLELNKKHLNHNTLTDIITFDNSSQVSEVRSPKTPNIGHPTSDIRHLTSDIFISIERVNENAEKFNVSREQELHRVMVHGLLHLLGYKDKNPADKAEMTGKEDYYLKRF